MVGNTSTMYRGYRIDSSAFCLSGWDVWDPDNNLVANPFSLEMAHKIVDKKLREKRVDLFCAVYQKSLEICHSNGEYLWDISELPRVMDRMRAAFVRGTYNKEGKALDRTRNILGIKHTRRDMERYFDE